MQKFNIVTVILFAAVCSGCGNPGKQPANMLQAERAAEQASESKVAAATESEDLAPAAAPAATKTAAEIAAEAEAKAIANWVPQVFTTQMAERASTVQLVKVTASTRVDERLRIGCGGIHQRCDFEILSSSGAPVKSVNIPIEYGGCHPGPFPTPTPTELLPGSLQVGKEYWFLFGADYDFMKHPHPVVAWWPAEQAPAELAALVERDAYHWRPTFHKESGLTFGYETLPEGWEVMVKRDGELLWKEAESGPVADYEYVGRHYVPIAVYAGPGLDMEPIGEVKHPHEPNQKQIYLLFTVSRIELGEGNRFDLAPGKYRLRVARELTTGQKLAEWALKPEWPADDALAMRQFHHEDGRLLVSARYEFFPTGGLAAGSTEESWLRKTLIRYEESERPSKTEVYYNGSVKDDQGRHLHSGWVPVQR